MPRLGLSTKSGGDRPRHRHSYGDGGAVKLAAAITEVDGKPQVHTAVLSQKRTLMGAGKVEVGAVADLTPHIAGVPQAVIVNGAADGVVVTTRAGDIHYFFRTATRCRCGRPSGPLRMPPTRRSQTFTSSWATSLSSSQQRWGESHFQPLRAAGRARASVGPDEGVHKAAGAAELLFQQPQEQILPNRRGQFRFATLLDDRDDPMEQELPFQCYTRCSAGRTTAFSSSIVNTVFTFSR
jgi:hypothetical protein